MYLPLHVTLHAAVYTLLFPAASDMDLIFDKLVNLMNSVEKLISLEKETDIDLEDIKFTLENPFTWSLFAAVIGEASEDKIKEMTTFNPEIGPAVTKNAAALPFIILRNFILNDYSSFDLGLNEKPKTDLNTLKNYIGLNGGVDLRLDMGQFQMKIAELKALQKKLELQLEELTRLQTSNEVLQNSLESYGKHLEKIQRTYDNIAEINKKKNMLGRKR